MASEVKIHGADDIVRKLKALGPKLAKKGLRAALRKGANIIRDDARAIARGFDRSETPEAIYKEIVASAGSSRRGGARGDMVMRVGVRGGAKRYVDNRKNRRAGRAGETYEGPGKVYYWRFLELGTSKMRARPFLVPAMTRNVERVISVVVVDLNSFLDSTAKAPA